MRINNQIIKALNPCKDRLNNYLRYYENRDLTVRQFFKLANITHHDKLWVVLRLVSYETKVVFTLDCVFSANAANAAYAAYSVADVYTADAYDAYANAAADAAAYAIYAAYAAANVAAERARQFESLLYLIEGEET